MRGLSPSALTAVAGITALIGTIKSLVSVGANIINVTSQFEQTQKSLETVLQSAQKGKQMFEDLRKFSFDTTFGVDELASASSQLLNVGVSTRELQYDLKMLGDLAQGDKVKFQELTSIFAKIQSTGKASAMQLQQLALRGIPINQTLKEMGVVGTASAEDLTKAFEKLTGEGGQFHDAMNNIIDTIEGKQGFITDTIKEINVNFGELTGLTDAYKTSLDVIYNVLNGLNNVLAKMNEHPIVKALIQGAIATAISAIGVSLLAGLVPALTLVQKHIDSLNKKLGTTVVLKSILDPKTLAIAGTIGALVGIGVTIASIAKSTEKAKEEAIDYGTTIKSFKKDGDAWVEQVQEVERSVKSINDIVTGMQESGNSSTLIDDLKKGLDELESRGNFSEGYDESYDEQWRRNKEFYESYKTMLENQVSMQKSLTLQQDSLLEKEEARKKILEEQTELYQAQLEEAKKLYSKTNQGQLEELAKKLADAQSLLKNGRYGEIENKNAGRGGMPSNVASMKSYGYTALSDDEKKYFEEMVRATEEAMKKIKDQMKLERLLTEEGGWRAIMQDALGMTDEDVINDKLQNGGKAFEDFVNKLENDREKMTKTNEALGVNQEGEKRTTVIGDEIKQLMDIYNKLIGTGMFGVDENGQKDNFTQQFEETKKRLSQAFLDAGGEAEELAKLLGNASEEIEDYDFVGSLKDGLLSAISGTDAGTFAQAFKDSNGNLLQAGLETLANSLIKVIGGMEGLDLILNPITDILESISPALKAVALLVYMLLAPIRVLAEGLKKLFGWLFKDMEEAWDSLTEEQQTEIERLKELNEQYKNLTSSIKEQEEYYLEMKKMINASTYADKMYKVNDMILTPQGNFSTAPDDYIIATKNPSALGGNSVTMIKPVINDYAGNNVQVETRQDSNGMQELIINISKKVADDYANGRNGWSSAYQLKQSKVSGRRVN